jgi:hypothetical protein
MLAVIERVAIRQSKNTRLELRDTAIGIRAAKIGSHLARLLPRRSLVSLLVFFTAAILQGFPAMKGNAFVHQENTTDGTADEQTHPYLEDTPKQLVKHVPELKGIRPAADQQELAMILGKTADRVDEFFSNVVDLVAHEEIRQERNGYSSITETGVSPSLTSFAWTRTGIAWRRWGHNGVSWLLPDSR